MIPQASVRVLLAASLALLLPSPALQAADRLSPYGIGGTVLLSNVDTISDDLATTFVDAAGGDEAEIVIVVGPDERLADDDEKKLLEPWQAAMPDSVSIATVASRAPANDAGLLAKVHRATGVWLAGFDSKGLAAIGGDSKLAGELRTLVRRGDAVGVNGSAVAMLGSEGFSDDKASEPVAGLGLLAGCIVDAGGSEQSGDDRLRKAIDKQPGRLGISLKKGTTLAISGRLLRPLDDDTATVILPPGKNWTRKRIELRSRRPGDWNQLQRAVHDRGNPDYLPQSPSTPEVPNGSLVIIGGGSTPPEVLKKFIELAGGADARLVVFPTAMPDPINIDPDSRYFHRAGVKNVAVLPAREQAEVDSAANIELLKKATAIWFGGGRQWRFVDAYEGTKTEKLIRDVLQRGGVIGGSSAGATIQGDYLVRGSPFGPEIMMCEGYERGLSLLPGVAIDQHFTTRNRFTDMTSLIKKYPQFLGIGLDEATAIIVQGHVAEVIGRGKAHFYDSRKNVEPGDRDYEAAAAGDRYDLKERKLIGAEKPKEKAKNDKPVAGR